MDKDSSGIRVLVIDADRDVCDFVVEHVLIPNGHVPILAHEGGEGLRRAYAQIADLILLDDELPGLSTLEALQALASRHLHVPIILMTSQPVNEISVQMLRLGVRDCIGKPFSAARLLQSIERVTFEVQLRREKTELENLLAQTKRRTNHHLFELSIFHELGKAITTRMPLDVLLERIADAAVYITQSEECILTLNDPETGELTEKVSRRRMRGEARPLVPFSSPDADRSGAIAAMLHIPLRLGSTQIGVLVVINKTTPRSFGDHERQMLRTVADFAAIAVENARMSRQAGQAEDAEPAPPASD